MRNANPMAVSSSVPTHAQPRLFTVFIIRLKFSCKPASKSEHHERGDEYYKQMETPFEVANVGTM